jgi:Contractile injection system tube protein
MQRATFLVEESGDRIPCLLNPESVLISRVAGLRTRESLLGPLTGAGLGDDPIIYTGGGRTELQLDLLFDVTLGGSSLETEDVRDLTGPLWALTENLPDPHQPAHPPLVRFVWGKSLNVPGVIAAVSERLEYFNDSGSPRRSWLRIKLLRVSDPPAEMPEIRDPFAKGAPSTMVDDEPPAGEARAHEVLGGGGPEPEPGSTERLDQIADRYYRDPSLWRLVAAANGLDNPAQVPAGSVLAIPGAGGEQGA